jgi:hypothetical protein
MWDLTHSLVWLVQGAAEGMARHVYTVLCRKASIDQVNSLSMFDAVEELNVFPLPPDELVGKVIIAYPMTLVSYWMREKKAKPEVAKQRIRLFGPSGAVLGSNEFEFDLQKTTSARNMANAEGLLYGGLGDYEFEVSAIDKGGDATVVARFPFELKLGPDPAIKKS